MRKLSAILLLCLPCISQDVPNVWYVSNKCNTEVAANKMKYGDQLLWLNIMVTANNDGSDQKLLAVCVNHRWEPIVETPQCTESVANKIGHTTCKTKYLWWMEYDYPGGRKFRSYHFFSDKVSELKK